MHPKLRLLLNWLADGIVSLPPAGRAGTDVLFVRLDAIGDFVLWLREAQHLREAFPGKRIALAANAVWAPLARQLPYWDEVIDIDVGRYSRTLGYRWRCLRRMRRGGFGTAVQPTYSRTLNADTLVRASRATRRIASQGDLTNLSPRQKRISDRWYTELLPVHAAAATEIERNHAFMRALADAPPRPPVFLLPQVAHLPVELKPPSPYFIVFPGAMWAGRQWPSKLFAQTIDSIEREYGWRAVLCGSAKERELCAEVASLCAKPPLNLAGSTALAEFCELVRQARLVVANETSAVHIAAAVHTPSICLLGGGHYGRFVPYPASAGPMHPEPVFEQKACYGCDWRCTQPHAADGPVPCISTIPAHAVLAAAERVLSRQGLGATPSLPNRPVTPQSGGFRQQGGSTPMPRVSVLTVVRNGAATLHKAIESVIHQLGDNAEYIVVDGASTDGTLAIVREYERHIAYWSSEPDRGIYDAMNKALAAARGDWVIFIGADDQLKPVLQHMIAELRDLRAVYYGNVQIASTSAIYGGRFSRYRLMQQNICHQAIFYPRRSYRHKAYDTNCGLLADHRYNIELMGSGVPFVHIDETISLFNDQGLSAGPEPGFEAVKLKAIRSSFGWPFYAIKRLRNGCVRMLKGKRVAA